MQQSFQRWEWLIINDGSTDPEALSSLEDYRRKDPRIRVIDHPANRGLSAARNTGFREARASYIVQLDSDDLLEPTAVEKWYWFLESHPEFAFCKGYSVAFGAQQYLWKKGFHEGSAFLQENQVDATSIIRKQVHEITGGYDEANRGGLEDWDFWLRCASFGYWGNTIPEYLNWYRRRPNHAEQWPNWDAKAQQEAFRARLRERYSQLWEGNFPAIESRWHKPSDTVSDSLPFENGLAKSKPRLLMIIPCLNFGGTEKFNLDLLQQLNLQGWETSIAATVQAENCWLPLFARYTPDIFILHHFLRVADYPRFLRYLIRSRQVDVVLVSHNEFGYMILPYLRAHFPEVTFLDFCHIEDWLGGAYPRMAVEYQQLVDLSIVSSRHLEKWLVQRGTDPEKVRVCYTNVDPEEWKPDPERRVSVRRDIGVEEGMPLVLYAGRICGQKQPRVFAATMLRLRQQGLPYAALVAGDGPDADWLQKFVKEHQLHGQLHLLGAVATDRMRELMAAADIFFLPSQTEGIALTIYESMASGLPVVGADVGGQRELVTPGCGVLIEPADEEVEAIKYAGILADLLRDPRRRIEMGRLGRERVCSQFRLDQMGKKMVELLTEAMALHASRAHAFSAPGLERACAALAVDSMVLRVWTKEQDQAKLWLENGWQAALKLAEERKRMIDELKAWIPELEKGKAWLEEQWQTWQAVAEERERIIQEQQSWITELEKGKAWLDEQWQTWQKVAHEHERTIQEQHDWIGRLEKGNAWLEEQRKNWQKAAEDLERAIQSFQQSAWTRLGMRLRTFKLPDNAPKTDPPHT